MPPLLRQETQVCDLWLSEWFIRTTAFRIKAEIKSFSHVVSLQTTDTNTTYYYLFTLLQQSTRTGVTPINQSRFLDSTSNCLSNPTNVCVLLHENYSCTSPYSWRAYGSFGYTAKGQREGVLGRSTVNYLSNPKM